MFYKNKKNGNIYRVLNDNVINCTNANDQQIMILYEDFPNREYRPFVRERSEFYEKFEPIEEVRN